MISYGTTNITVIDPSSSSVLYSGPVGGTRTPIQTDSPKDITLEFECTDRTTIDRLQSLHWLVDDVSVYDRNGTVLFTGTYDDCVDFILQQKYKRVPSVGQ